MRAFDEGAATLIRFKSAGLSRLSPVTELLRTVRASPSPSLGLPSQPSLSAIAAGVVRLALARESVLRKLPYLGLKHRTFRNGIVASDFVHGLDALCGPAHCPIKNVTCGLHPCDGRRILVITNRHQRHQAVNPLVFEQIHDVAAVLGHYLDHPILKKRLVEQIGNRLRAGGPDWDSLGRDQQSDRRQAQGKGWSNRWETVIVLYPARITGSRTISTESKASHLVARQGERARVFARRTRALCLTRERRGWGIPPARTPGPPSQGQ